MSSMMRNVICDVAGQAFDRNAEMLSRQEVHVFSADQQEVLMEEFSRVIRQFLADGKRAAEGGVAT